MSTTGKHQAEDISLRTMLDLRIERLTIELEHTKAIKKRLSDWPHAVFDEIKAKDLLEILTDNK